MLTNASRTKRREKTGCKPLYDTILFYFQQLTIDENQAFDLKFVTVQIKLDSETVF